MHITPGNVAYAGFENTMNNTSRFSDSLSDAPPGARLGRRCPSAPPIIGESQALRSVLEQACLFARSDAPVLITGESGTGKELLARYIHQLSPVVAGPLIDLNCAGIPSTLISTELFGHERGAFTNAVQRRVGRIESANGGSLFLDEIGDMPVELQPFLLRFLEEGKIQRVGGQQSLDLDVRIIAATNQDLDRHVESGRFRQDLLYRLNTLTLELPPLRDRGSDVLLLADFALRRWSRPGEFGNLGLTDEAKAALLSHDWPGNIRELMGRIRRALLLAQRQPITRQHLCLPAGSKGPAGSQGTGDRRTDPAEPRENGNGHVTVALPCKLDSARAEVERAVVAFALGKHHHNLSAVARDIGISRGTLYKLLEHHGLSKDAAQKT